MSLVEYEEALLNKQDNVFPDWMKDRKDFQTQFPRFSNGAVRDDDRVRIALLKPGKNRNTNDIENISRWINRAPSMQSLNATQANELSRLCQLIRFPSGAFVFHQGDPGDACYFIFSGNVHILVDGAKVGMLTEGSCFGEVALEVQCRGRTAAVQAAMDLEVLQIRAEDYKNTLQRYHSNRKKQVMKWLRKEVQLLSDFSEHRLKYFETVSVDLMVRAGDVIYHEGDDVGAIYFVKSGKIELEKNMKFQSRSDHKGRGTVKVHVSFEEMGDHFGSEHLMEQDKRAYTATATENAHLIVVNKIDCNNFLFQGRTLDKLMMRFHTLHQICCRSGAHKMASLKRERSKKDKDHSPILLVPSFPEHRGSPATQFPCLVRGEVLSTNLVVRKVQLSIYQPVITASRF